MEGGVPFEKVHGMNVFEYPGKDPSFNQVFNTAMINHTTLVLKNILDNYNGFEQIGCLVDVAGGLGVTLSLITSKYPSIKGINFDLPHVIQHAPAYPGVEHVGGDMFESVPKGDAIFMKWILHDWSDHRCVKLLKNCYNAIPEKGKVIVVEAVVPTVPEANAYSRGITQMDVLMMTQNPGGKERTKQEFEALASKAGFSGMASGMNVLFVISASWNSSSNCTSRTTDKCLDFPLPCFPLSNIVNSDRVPMSGEHSNVFIIIHDWSDEHCVKLLKHYYNAILEDEKVIVVEAVVPTVPEADATQNTEGKERTKPEFEALASKAGFSGIRYECFVCNLWVMEFFK
ncbi:hypothetical protein GQ457_16G006680 [Hibiscus cannabinus]